MSRTEGQISVLANTEAFLLALKERPRTEPEIPKAGPERKAKAFLLNTEGSLFFSEIFTQTVLAALQAEVDLDLRVVTPESYPSLRAELQDAEVLVSTWGLPAELVEPLAELPRLKLVLYAGGSVKPFAMPFLRRGIQVVGGRDANAVAVAEFCLAQVILSNKGYFRNVRMCCRPETADQTVAFVGCGNYGATVALLGYGSIARRLRKMLRPLNLQIVVVDPTLSAEEAAEEGIRITSLEEAFSEAQTVSNHLPNFPSLERILTARYFRLLRPDATFINTGRGQQVDEAGLIEVLRERPDLTALLDVTHPEPPASGSPLYEMANVQLSSHIAGVVRDERKRLTDLIIDELRRFRRGEPLRYSNSLAELKLMA